MAIIQREDGTQFVLRCYRETLSLSNTTLFKQHAFLISEMHGYFAKFFSGKNSKSIESVFSSDAGYILAEMVWKHFGNPANLVFCEARPDQSYICITVRDGIVFSDGEFNEEELREELAATISMQANTPIYTYGNIPGLTVTEEKQASIPHLNTNNITVLESSLIEVLEPTPDFELVPIQQAISDLQLSKASKRKVLMMTISAISLVVALVAYFIYYQATKPPPVEVVDPLTSYRTALISADPTAEIQQAVNGLLIVNSIAGWQLKNASIKDNQLSGILHSYGGSAVDLLSWTKRHNGSISFNQKGAQLNLALGPLANRPAPAAPQPITQLTAILIDDMLTLIPQKSLMLGATTSRGAYSILSVTIHFTQLSPDVITLIGNALHSLPVTVDDIALSDSGSLINGDIKITLYGN